MAFIGKGVTFDTGGISIKPAAGMEDMKWDMGGAGTVVGLMAALAGRRAQSVNAVGLVGLVENMPSGTAMRPGDVVQQLFRPDDRGAEHRCGGPAGSGRRALVRATKIRAALHGRSGDADRRDHRGAGGTSMPGCSATTTTWRPS